MIFIKSNSSKKLNFLLPTNDYIFKSIFGRIGNENITKNLLESILDTKINSITLDTNPILEKYLANDKLGILDVKVKLENNILCDIEVQVIPFLDLNKRLLFYWSRSFSSSIKSGESYDKLKKSIIILIADFDFRKFEHLKSLKNFHTTWKIKENEKPQYILTDAFEIHIISLKLVEKLFQKVYNKNSIDKSNENYKNLISWLKFIKKPDLLEETDMENVEIKEAKKQFDEITRDEYTQRLAEYRMKELRDKKAIELYGYNSGLEDGEKKGIQKGKKEGKIEGKIEIAKKMLKENMDIKLILKLTGLTEKQIKKL